MGKRSKPWLNYKSDALEREYPSFQKRKRSFGWATFWLFAGGYWGAHRLYLWEPRKAAKILILYIGLNILSLYLSLLFFSGTLSESGMEIVTTVSSLLPYLIIVVFEAKRLRGHVNAANKKYLLR